MIDNKGLTEEEIQSLIDWELIRREINRQAIMLNVQQKAFEIIYGALKDIKLNPQKSKEKTK